MALTVGTEVDVVIDGVGIYRGVVHELPSKNIVVVRIKCAGQPCDLGYRHPVRAEQHLSRVNVKKVNPVRLPKPFLSYDQIDWGTDE